MEFIDRAKYLSTEQGRVLSQLKERFPDKGEPFLCRFGWRRNWDLNATIDLIEQFIAWRTPYGEVKLEDFSENVLRLGMSYYFGETKLGVPIVVIKASNVQLDSLTLEEIIRFNIYFIEKVLAAHPFEVYSVIFDYEGLSMKNVNWSWLKELLHVWNDFYPECSNVEYFINMPFVFKAVWSFVKPFLTQRAKSAIQLLGSDYKTVLVGAIEPDELQKCYGGSNDWVLDKSTDINECLGFLGSAKNRNK